MCGRLVGRDLQELGWRTTQGGSLALCRRPVSRSQGLEVVPLLQVENKATRVPRGREQLLPLFVSEDMSNHLFSSRGSAGLTVAFDPVAPSMP